MTFSMPTSMPWELPSPPASAPISWKRPAFNCSSVSMAIISSSWDCRSWRCCNISGKPAGSPRELFDSLRYSELMFILGLTGSVGMGKSTTARFFAEEGVPVYDADAEVHRLYEGAAAPAIEAAFPGTTVGGKVDRTRLAARVLGDAAALKQLEAIVHPLVREAEHRL